MKTSKYVFGLLAGFLSLLAVSLPAQAQYTYGSQPIYGYVSQPAVSPLVTKGVSGVLFTNVLTGGSTYTNLTLLSSVGTKDLAIQFSNTGTNTLLWTLARSVSGGSFTNLNGNPAYLENFAVVTNAANSATVLNLGSSPTTPANVQVLTSFNDGAIPYIYVYSVQVVGGTSTVTYGGTNAYTFGVYPFGL